MASFMSMANPNESPRLGWRDALARGEQLMADQSARHGFTFRKPLGLMYIPEIGAYIYDVRGSRDIFERAPKGGSTSVTFDGNTGELRELSQPRGEHLGNTLESWLYPSVPIMMRHLPQDNLE
jgi:hypothetical protein